MSSRIEPSPARRAVRRARVAAAMSWGAAALAAAFAGLFVFQAGLFGNLLPEPPATPPVVENPRQIAVKNSTITGFDREGQPYSIVSRSVTQDQDKPNLVHLDAVRGTFQKHSGEDYVAEAERGRYDTKAKLLDLVGHVKLVSVGKFTVTMDKALVIVKEKKLRSGSPVVVDLNGQGTILANALEIRDDGKYVLLYNGVKARFQSKGSQGVSQP